MHHLKQVMIKSTVMLTEAKKRVPSTSKLLHVPEAPDAHKLVSASKGPPALEDTGGGEDPRLPEENLDETGRPSLTDNEADGQASFPFAQEEDAADRPGSGTREE